MIVTTLADFTVLPFTVIVDTAEQMPYSFHAIPPRAEHKAQRLVVPTKREHLATGDYSIEGFENRVAVERKSLNDLYGTLAAGRGRFGREFERLQDMEFAAVVVEADWRNVCKPGDPHVQQKKALDTLVDAAYECLRVDCSVVEAAGRRLLDTLDPVKTALETIHSLDEYTEPNWQSRLNPRSVWGTIFSWGQRYPTIHWYTMGSRRLGELATFEILERFWRENHDETTLYNKRT